MESLVVRPLEERDLPDADRVFRLAFGTFLGLPDPLRFAAGADYVRTRWRADPLSAFAAELDGELVGSNFATCWGSVGFFGPLTVRPDLWEQGVAKRLMEPVMGRFEHWGTAHEGLFTFPQSPKHVHLYQKFGFWARFLTPVMFKPVQRAAAKTATYSELPEDRQEDCLSACRELTGAIYEGLDVEREIVAAHGQGLGDTVLLRGDSGGKSELVGLAVCHVGGGTEAGEGVCYIKFGAVRPGPDAAQHFDRLLEACEALAAERGMSRLVAGVNMGRQEAYRRMIGGGFRTELQGVAMERGGEPGYNRPGVYLVDDWR